MEKNHNNERHLLLATHIFSKVSLIMCLTNTHIFVYGHASYYCNLLRFLGILIYCVFWVFSYIIIDNVWSIVCSPNFARCSYKLWKAPKLDDHLSLKFCIFTKLYQRYIATYNCELRKVIWFKSVCLEICVKFLKRYIYSSKSQKWCIKAEVIDF